MEAVLLIARVLLASVFGIAGVSKLADRSGSQQALRDFGVPSRLATPFGILLPLAELTVAIALLPTTSAWWSALGALALLMLFIIGISVNLAQGRKPDCHCFGQLHSEPVGWGTLARNCVLAALAGFILWQGRNDTGLSAVAWVGELSTAERIGVALSVLSLGLCAIQSWFVLHLLRQNGRLLTRMEQLEARLMPGVQRTHTILEPAAGLPLGTPAPAFDLPDLHGERVTLDTLRAAGKPVLLLFSDLDCGACNALMPEIDRWQSEYAAKMTMVVISRGSLEANRAKSAQHNIRTTLLQKNLEVAATYKSYGTPSAVVVTPEGTIGSALAGGADAIRVLVMRTAGLLPMLPHQHLPLVNGHHRHASNGQGHAIAPPQRMALRGQPAPSLRLPDLDGKTVDLASFRGEATLVVFWNPGCGFCQRMLPALKAWEDQRSDEAPRLLVVSRGMPEANRAMGLRSPVVLDQGFTVGRAFGASGTPSGVLVDAESRIASETAVGAQAVLALAGYSQAQAATA